MLICADGERPRRAGPSIPTHNSIHALSLRTRLPSGSCTRTPSFSLPRTRTHTTRRTQASTVVSCHAPNAPWFANAARCRSPTSVAHQFVSPWRLSGLCSEHYHSTSLWGTASVWRATTACTPDATHTCTRTADTPPHTTLTAAFHHTLPFPHTAHCAHTHLPHPAHAGLYAAVLPCLPLLLPTPATRTHAHTHASHTTTA